MKHRCGAFASAARTLVPLAAVASLLAAPDVARADEPPPEDFPTRGLFHAGPIYTFGMGDRADFDSFQYFTVGGGADHEWFRVGVETPMPFILLDGIAGIIGALAGADLTIPVFDALNGDQDPGRIRLFQLEAFVRPLRKGPHGLEVGLVGHYDQLQAYENDVRHGSAVFNLGATAGYVFSNRDLIFRGYVTGGNGFGNLHDGNPFVGFGATVEVPFAPPVALNIAFDFIGQHLDLRRESPYATDRSDVDEWTAFGTTVIGLGAMF